MFIQNFRPRLTIVFLVLLGCTLPFANITKLIGIEDGFSRLTILLLMLLYLISELQRSRLCLKLNLELYIIILGFLFGIAASIFAKVELNLITGMFIKIFVLSSIYTIVNRNKAIFSYFIKYYYMIFLFSLFVSIPLWILHPVPEFVVYDGSEWRFAGLHFELFNYCFSLCIALCSWRYNDKNKFIGLSIFMMLGILSGSNMFPIFAIVFLAPAQLLNLLKYRVISISIILLIWLTPVFFGFFLSNVDFLVNFGMRAQGQFDVDGSSIYNRLFPFSLAADYISSIGYLSILPSGLGHFESSSLVKNTQLSFGGTGSPEALVDLGWVLFLLLGLTVGLKVCSGFNSWGNQRYVILRLNLACMLFISFGAGFFNLVAWSILFMSSVWVGSKDDTG